MPHPYLRPAAEECPKATRFLRNLPKEVILRWLLEYASGRKGLIALEDALSGVRYV